MVTLTVIILSKYILRIGFFPLAFIALWIRDGGRKTLPEIYETQDLTLEGMTYLGENIAYILMILMVIVFFAIIVYGIYAVF